MFHVMSPSGQEISQHEHIEDAVHAARVRGIGCKVLGPGGTLLATIESALKQWRAPLILGAGNAAVVPLNWGTGGGVR
jgi:hypothetical protein